MKPFLSPDHFPLLQISSLDAFFRLVPILRIPSEKFSAFAIRLHIGPVLIIIDGLFLSGIIGGGEMLPPSPVSRDQLHKRIESLQQQNRVLKVELETYKLRVKALQEENRALRQASVHIQVLFPLHLGSNESDLRIEGRSL